VIPPSRRGAGRRPVLPALLFAAALAGAGGAAISCSGGGGDAAVEADEYVQPCQEGATGRFASDEAFVTFVEREAAGAWTTGNPDAPRLASPAAGATLSASTPPVVRLELPMAAAPGAGGAPAACAAPRPRRGLARWLSPIGVAHAHCRVSGDLFLLRLSHQGKPVYTAVLSVTSFTPRAETWRAKLAGREGQTLDLALVRATFSNNRIEAGPHAAPAATFTVGP
jgi:hypothetical protein